MTKGKNLHHHTHKQCHRIFILPLWYNNITSLDAGHVVQVCDNALDRVLSQEEGKSKFFAFLVSEPSKAGTSLQEGLARVSTEVN